MLVNAETLIDDALEIDAPPPHDSVEFPVGPGSTIAAGSAFWHETNPLNQIRHITRLPLRADELEFARNPRMRHSLLWPGRHPEDTVAIFGNFNVAACHRECAYA
jgi:hypothetical protein